MDAALIVVGALLCWRAPMPDLTRRVELPVIVMELKTLPTGEAGAWVQTTTGRLARQQWHVAHDDLVQCTSSAGSDSDAAGGPPVSVH